ncbi:MAG: K(+)-transporting ATPase subunit F [Verrucomicrobiales bacterium]|nr:K(+)-transporting ATPase subunit F [Verrucomicrobiales bacterium]
MSATTHPSTMETIFPGLIAIALLAYLTVAMLRPERF